MGFSPKLIRGELNLRSHGRITAMLRHIGSICEYFLDLNYKSQLGTWRYAVGDEAASGKSKKTKNLSAKPASQKGLRWWFSFVNVKRPEFAEVKVPKCTDYVFEWINDNIRDTPALTWHVERLVALNGTFVSDCHKGYSAIGVTVRPDINHLDCNHSEGFGAPGPKSIARGITQITSNESEGAHSLFFNMCKNITGTKTGKGSPEQEAAVRHIVAAFINWKWHNLNPLQQIFLWMRQLHVRQYGADGFGEAAYPGVKHRLQPCTRLQGD